MNVLVLMAGGSEPFEKAGYLYPRNLTEIAGLPLVQRVVESLASLREAGHRFIFAVRKEENRRHHTGEVIRLLLPEAELLEVSSTAGAACTALLAIEKIDNETPLLILNGDEIRHVDLQEIVEGFVENRLDGGIAVFRAVHPRWSYVRCGGDGLVEEAAEKRPISDLATAGAYWFARGSDFVRAAMSMIRKDAHVDGAFYLCPVYNELILEQARIGVREIPREAYFKLANPQEVRAYESWLERREDLEREGA